jgi:hypothetical protein
MYQLFGGVGSRLLQYNVSKIVLVHYVKAYVGMAAWAHSLLTSVLK